MSAHTTLDPTLTVEEAAVVPWGRDGFSENRTNGLCGIFLLNMGCAQVAIPSDRVEHA
ncbi:hypothetical protein [Nocardia nova]|uniref:hypothetical protein n=1 Tax=Nocardia nova TaxID=37330 RepID=UPI00340DB7D7